MLKKCRDLQKFMSRQFPCDSGEIQGETDAVTRVEKQHSGTKG